MFVQTFAQPTHTVMIPTTVWMPAAASATPVPMPAAFATQQHFIPQQPAPIAAAPLHAQRNKGNAVLFVGQLNYDVTEADVYKLFSFYGTVVNVVLLKDPKRNNTSPNSLSDAATRAKKMIIGSSAFVTYSTTEEADLAIMSLHDRYCMDNREKPLQVSYCQKTDIISEFGFRHALRLHEKNPANPLPLLTPQIRPLM